MDFLDLAPRGMVGWQEELDGAPALLLGGPGEMRCRLFVTAKGITLMVAAKDLAAARDDFRAAMPLPVTRAAASMPSRDDRRAAVVRA